jgi:hypothetical protein
LRPKIDLYLLRDSLSECAEITYFSGGLHEFTTRLIDAINHVLANATTYGPDIVRAFALNVRAAERYLSGSTTKESPYEIEYCLKAALRTRTTREFLITTALTEDQNFHFLPSDPWQFIKKTITRFDAKGFDALLVQLGVPKIYSHKPIYCIPLYHELGHFVDFTTGITQFSLLKNPGLHPTNLFHRREHFADLFAACYVGSSSIRTLETIALGAAASLTHPATTDRVALVNKFLTGQTGGLIDAFQHSLSLLGGVPLSVVYRAPDVKQPFDDIRPYHIADSPELHGIFESAWTYLADALDNRSPPWVKPAFSESEIERVVNDLAEKSIRNMSIRERWASGSSAKR